MSQCPEGVPMAGGIGHEKPADDKVREILEKLRSQIKEKIEGVHGKPLNDHDGPLFEAIAYKSQIVAGSNYFIKVKILGDNDDKIWHLRVYEHWSGNPLEVASVVQKELDHEITYFD